MFDVFPWRRRPKRRRNMVPVPHPDINMGVTGTTDLRKISRLMWVDTTPSTPNVHPGSSFSTIRSVSPSHSFTHM